MTKKIYLHLLFFCVILCQEIFAIFSEKDTRLSSDVLVRKRRVINHLPGGRIATRIEHANYLVKIKEERRYSFCTGGILSEFTVITAALCVRQPLATYKVFSGGAYEERSNSHNVTSSVAYYGSLPHQLIDGIALITVDLPFEFSRRTGYIQLYVGPLPTGTEVTVFGWGYVYPLRPGPEARQRLRTISLPIMNHRECQNVCQGRRSITEKQICTYHPEQYCAEGDEGAPLVFNHMLVGIHVWKGIDPHQRNPEVFVNLLLNDYREWIREHTL